MNWINPPPTVRRFTRHQLIQHWTATGLAFILVASALPYAFPGGAVSSSVHVYAGMLSVAFLAWHLSALVAIGVRHDVPAGKLAFLPAGPEWKALAGRASYPAWKYAPEEKGDYLAILAWSVLLAASGVVLRWPGRLGISDAGAYAWVRAVHAGFGGAFTVHILLFHVPGRWVRARPSFRRAILSGKVPLEDALRRRGWVADLVSSGILVPAPEEKASESERESEAVRGLLERGNRLVREERYAEASAAFDEALKLLPDYSQARFNLGVSRMKEGRTDLAIEQFRLFIEADPFNPVAGRARELLDALTRGKGGEGR